MSETPADPPTIEVPDDGEGNSYDWIFALGQRKVAEAASLLRARGSLPADEVQMLADMLDPGKPDPGHLSFRLLVQQKRRGRPSRDPIDRLESDSSIGKRIKAATQKGSNLKTAYHDVAKEQDMSVETAKKARLRDKKQNKVFK